MEDEKTAGAGVVPEAPEEPRAADPQTRIAELAEELRKKSEEVLANQDRYLRAVAEAENSKKRLLRDKTDAIRFANESLLRELLQVIDSLELAVAHADLGSNGRSVVEGVQLTLRLFRDILERNGVKEIGDPTGTSFDPVTQEAAAVEVSDIVATNTVIRVQTKGYRYHDRLLRPARVVVAAAPAEAQDAAHDEADDEPVH